MQRALSVRREQHTLCNGGYCVSCQEQEPSFILRREGIGCFELHVGGFIGCSWELTELHVGGLTELHVGNDSRCSCFVWCFRACSFRAL